MKEKKADVPGLPFSSSYFIFQAFIRSSREGLPAS